MAILRPGGFGRVRIQTGVNENALLVPQPAVIEVQSQYQVIVLTPENKAVYRPIKVGDRVGPNWIITEGLKPGEKVVVEGIQKGYRCLRRPRRQNGKGRHSGRRQALRAGLSGGSGATDHVEILYQSSHRRDSHRNSDGAGRRGGDPRAPYGTVPQYRRPDDPGESHLPWRGRPDDCRVRCNADRTADVGRQRHELHVLVERQLRRRHDAVR